MSYTFYKIVTISNKNKRVYKKKNSRKLYCKYNGKMIQVKKYKELCKKTKPVKKKRGGENPTASPTASPTAVSRTKNSLYNDLDSLLGISKAIYDNNFKEALKQTINSREDKEYLLTIVKNNKEKYIYMNNLVRLFDDGNNIYNMAMNRINDKKGTIQSWKLRKSSKELIEFHNNLEKGRIKGVMFSLLYDFLKYYSNYDNICRIILHQLIDFDINIKDMKKEKEVISENVLDLIKRQGQEISNLEEVLKVRDFEILLNSIIDIIYRVIGRNKLQLLNQEMYDIIKSRYG